MAQIAKIVILVTLIAGVFCLSNCSEADNTISTPTPPMTTQFYKGYFTVSDAPIINKTVDLSFNLETIENAPGTTIQFYLPPAIQFINGNLKWTGDIMKGEKIVKTISVMAQGEGEWRIAVWVENNQFKGLDRFFYCYLNSYKSTGSLTDKPTTLPGPQAPATKIQ